MSEITGVLGRSFSGKAFRCGVFCAVLLSALGCRDLPRAGTPPERFEARILSPATSLRSRSGDLFVGYLADAERNYQKSRLFLSFEIRKYEAGERITVYGHFLEDVVRIRGTDDSVREYPVFFVRRASPSPIKEIELPPVLSPRR